MARALCYSTGVKLPHTALQTFLLACKIPLIADDECLVRWIISCERLLVGIDRLHQWTENPAKPHARQIHFARCHVEYAGAMRHHLCDIHLAPLMLRSRCKPVDASTDFVDCISFKQIFHFSPSRFRNHSRSVQLLGFAMAPVPAPGAPDPFIPLGSSPSRMRVVLFLLGVSVLFCYIDRSNLSIEAEM